MGLFKPAWQSNNEEKALKAVEAENDQTALIRIAKNARYSSVGIAAISKITDLKILDDISLFIENKPKFDTHLIRVVKEKQIALIESSVDRLSQSELIDIVNSVKNQQVRMIAVSRVANQAALINICKSRSVWISR